MRRKIWDVKKKKEEEKDEIHSKECLKICEQPLFCDCHLMKKVPILRPAEKKRNLPETKPHFLNHIFFLSNFRICVLIFDVLILLNTS